jgi:hypothetical protein
VYNRILKLISGDEVIAKLTVDTLIFPDNDVIELHYPMLVKYYRVSNEEGRVYQTCSINPWINMTDDNIINIKSSFIVTAANLSKQASASYEEYIRMLDKEDSEEYSYLKDMLDFIEKNNDEEETEDEQKPTIH